MSQGKSGSSGGRGSKPPGRAGRRVVTIPGLHIDLRGDDLVTTREARKRSTPPKRLSRPPDTPGAKLPLDERLFKSPRTSQEPTARFDPVLPAKLFLGGDSAEPVPTSRKERRSAPEPDLPQSGAILEKYRIEELIGVGGFAAVYRATHLMLRNQVAIKMLKPSVMKRRPGLAAMLCEEARFAAKIDHPNVVRVFDVTHLPEITYIVMEYLEGRTLAKWIRAEGRLSARDVMRVGIDVARGLEAGLGQGLVHRDIKPQNIIVTRSGTAKIVDLGLAHSLTLRSDGSDVSKSSGSTLVGTHGYIAPEAGPGRPPTDFRADIYALGVTLYLAAVGQPPFPTVDPDLCLRLHREQPVPPPPARVDAELSRLLLWMLEKKPENRPPSYAALIDALNKALPLVMP
ncbi:MAG: protein kinase [Polyangiaceae bacterium]